jgi:hypothetical protein
VITVDANTVHLPTRVVVDAVQRTPQDTAEILASLPAEVLQTNLAPVMQMLAQMHQSSMMQLAADIQRITEPLAVLAAQMERVTAPIRQVMAQAQAALAPLAKMMAQRSDVLELVRKIRELMPTFLGTVVVRAVLSFWHLRPWTLTPNYLCAQAAPRSTHPRGQMKARAPGATRMILQQTIRGECLAV